MMMDLLDLSKAASGVVGHGAAGVHLISSPCIYYHYLCDGIDDKGWGCGYRSLQSLCSWVVMQNQKWRETAVMVERGRREREEGMSFSGERGADAGEEGEGESVSVKEELRVPSLRGIQEALVEVEDKPAGFVGSREWIGCFEACLVLDHLFSVACKVVHVSRGGEVVNHVKMLAQHFDSIGSPVMIGGDVDGASKTLIGILLDQSQLTNTQFLVADPHYIVCSGVCGEESDVGLPGATSRDAGALHGNTASLHGNPATLHGNTTVLHGDTGVRWHDLNLFQDASFYNFCLPQGGLAS